MSKLIKLGGSRGLSVIVDDDDFERLSQRHWIVNMSGPYQDRPYAITSGKGRAFMHRELLGLEAGDGRMGDHINGDSLDNQRHNLRIATRSQNLQNSKLSRKNVTGYKGVHVVKKKGKPFRARIKLNRKCYNLGSFINAEDAARAYDAAARELFGQLARTNFP